MSEGLLAVGEAAPRFEALTSDGDRVALADFLGRKSVMLMFYPVDDTPGCTRQMCAARDEREDYLAAGIERFGVNHGSLESHRGFADRYTLDFPILVDEGGEIARAYGVRTADGGTARATYVIDAEGRIAYAEAGAHGAAEILEALRG